VVKELKEEPSRPDSIPVISPPTSTWPHLNSDVDLEEWNINRTVSML